MAEQAEESRRLEALRRRVLEGATTLPGVHATLPEGSRNVAHVPSTAHLWFEDGDTEALLMALDMAGIDVSAGSACHAGVTQPSHVLLAMGFDEGPARATLRCSMGRGTSAGGRGRPDGEQRGAGNAAESVTIQSQETRMCDLSNSLARSLFTETPKEEL